MSALSRPSTAVSSGLQSRSPAQSTDGHPERTAAVSPRSARVVTVSATYGAGGSVIAPRLAERLEVPFADRLIPARDAPVTAPGGERVTEEERRQTSRSRFLARLALLTGGLGLPVPHPEDLTDPVRQRVEQSIRDLVT